MRDLDLGKMLHAIPARYRVALLGLCLWIEASRADSGPAKAIWLNLLLVAALIAISLLTAPDPEEEAGRPRERLSIPTATEDRVVPIPWGTVMTRGPNVVDYFNFRKDAIKKTSRTLFIKTSQVIGHRYHLSLQLGVCQGAGVFLRKVFVDNKLAKDLSSSPLDEDGDTFEIDEPDFFGGDELGSGGLAATCTWYTGSSEETPNTISGVAQPVDAHIASNQTIVGGSNPTSPYRKTAYMVVHERGAAAATARGAYLGNASQIKPWALEIEHFVAQFPGQFGTDPHKVGAEVNLANVAYQVLTNEDWGKGVPAADIDAGTTDSSFVQAGITLKTEGNGFSLLLEDEIEHDKFLRELERQMDGTIRVNRRTGKWEIKLNRADYNIDTVPQITDSNLVKAPSFKRIPWQDTFNTVYVKYKNREKDYKDDVTPPAHDPANAQMQGGGTVGTIVHRTTTVTYPGVKTAALANQLAWRELRQRSYPLARATVVVDRTFWDLHVGDVVAFSNTELGITKMPMRVASVDLGTLTRGAITLQLVEDVFGFGSALYADGADTKWVPPPANLVAFPAAEQVAFESPRGVVVRDPDFGGDPFAAKVVCAARRQGNEEAFQIQQRNAAGTPTGDFKNTGVVAGFVEIGQLAAALDPGSIYPLASLLINATPSGQTALEAAFDDDATVQQLGQDLVHLIKIGDDANLLTAGDEAELALVQTAQTSGGQVQLNNVYRGVLGCGQRKHAINTPVYLLFLGVGHTDTSFPNDNQVELRFRAKTGGSLFSGTPNDIGPIRLNKRALRPYPPGSVSYNGAGSFFNTPDLEGDGSGLNGVGFDIDWRRRRYDTTDEVNELSQDFTPHASTEHRVRVYVDPDSANVEVHDSGWISGTGAETPTQAFVVNEAAAGTELRIQIDVRHDIEDETNLEGEQPLLHDVVPTSVRTGQFYIGGDKSSGVATTAYTVASATAHTVNIGASYSTAVVEHQINGGGWSTLIGTGLTTGTTAVLAVSDTLELRVTANEAPSRNFVEINDGTSDVAYGVFTDGT